MLIIWAEGFYWPFIKAVENGSFRGDNQMYGKMFRRVSIQDNTIMTDEKGWWKTCVLLRNANPENASEWFQLYLSAGPVNGHDIRVTFPLRDKTTCFPKVSLPLQLFDLCVPITHVETTSFFNFDTCIQPLL